MRLQTTLSFSLDRLGHKCGAYHSVAHLGTPCLEKNAFVFLLLQASNNSRNKAATVAEHQQGVNAMVERHANTADMLHTFIENVNTGLRNQFFSPLVVT